jgi:hypothetical protein
VTAARISVLAPTAPKPVRTTMPSRSSSVNPGNSDSTDAGAPSSVIAKSALASSSVVCTGQS